MEHDVLAERGLDRGRFLIAGASLAAGSGLAAALTRPDAAAAHGAPQPVPVPIPSVIDPGLPIHIQAPGPTDITLPFSGTQLFGLNYERTSVGDFSGDTVLAYLAGTATGSDGTEYGLEVDVRASEGWYRAADGSKNRGLFAFI